MFRPAEPADVPALTTLINLAYEIEYFKKVPRTDEDEILALVERRTFLVRDDGGSIAACIQVTADGERGLFAMLAVHPSKRGLGLARKLVAAAETQCRAAGCRFMDLEVVNLRTELPPFYRALGYVETATAPFPHPDRINQPCHMIVMSKAL